MSTSAAGPQLSDEEIARRFGFHKATIEGPQATQPRHILLRRAFIQFIGDLNKVLPAGRYTSLAITAFEEASMWSHKAIAEYAPLIEDDGLETCTEETMHKVFRTLLRYGLNGTEAQQAIEQMQRDEGILFREVSRADSEGALHDLRQKLERGF